MAEELESCANSPASEADNLHTEEMFSTHYGRRDWTFYRSLLSQVIIHAPPGRILDLGCGLGLFVECARRLGLEAEGIEGSPYAAAQCRRNNRPVHEQLLSAPFPMADGTVSAVVANQVLEHIPMNVVRHALQESFRVLRDGGVLIVNSPSRFDRNERLQPSHINLFTPSGIIREVKAVGFFLVEAHNVGRDFGLGRIGSVIGTRLWRLLGLDFLSRSANCVARKGAATNG